MQLQVFRQHGRRVRRIVVAGVETQVGDFVVQRAAYRSEIPQCLFAIRALQQRAAAVAGEALQLRGHVEVQVHDEAAFAQQATVSFVQYRAAAGGQRDSVAVEQCAQGRAFAGAETGLALAFEDRRDARAAAFLDLVVEVGEAQAEAFGQQPPDGALAGAHRSDQREIGGGIHRHDLNKRPPSLAVPGNRRHQQGYAMSVAKIVELNASSKTSMEDAVKTGLKKAGETIKNIKGAWVNEIKVVTDDNGNVAEWRVNLRVTFVVS